MPRQQRDKSNTGYYHIMIRGNDRKDIFLDEQDKLYFIKRLKAKKEFIKFTNMEEEDKFIEIDEKRNRMEEGEAIKLWGEIAVGEESLDEKLKKFREKAKLPLRKLAEITGINKDKINKMTKQDKKNRPFCLHLSPAMCSGTLWINF